MQVMPCLMLSQIVFRKNLTCIFFEFTFETTSHKCRRCMEIPSTHVSLILHTIMCTKNYYKELRYIQCSYGNMEEAYPLG